MIVETIGKRELYRSNKRTIRSILEEAVEEGVDLCGADLRRARLKGAALDGLKAKGACLWGADLTDANIAMADLEEADLRNALLDNTCFAESCLRGVDFSGACFKNVIFEDCRLAGSRFNSPSLFNCSLDGISDLEKTFYTDMDGKTVRITKNPVAISVRNYTAVVLGKNILLGGRLSSMDDILHCITTVSEAVLTDIQAEDARAVHFATGPILKRAGK